MPADNQDIRRFLESREALLLAELRRAVPETIKEYLEVRAALAGLDSHAEAERSKDEYSKFRKAIDAIEHYLKLHARFEHRRTIAQTIADGGFAQGEDRDPYGLVWDAFRYYNSIGRLAVKNDMVGLPDWDDSYFR